MIFAIGKNIYKVSCNRSRAVLPKVTPRVSYKRALSINNIITSDIQFLIQVINLLVY